MIFNATPRPGDFEDEYQFLSSTSISIQEQAERQAIEAIEHYKRETKKLPSHVLEIASNDGYLLEKIVKISPEIIAIGVDPSKLAGKIARKKGIRQYQGYFTKETVNDIRKFCRRTPDILIANNVITHVPNLSDFINAIADIMDKQTRVCLRYQSTERLLEGKYFESFYHENYNFPLAINIDELAKKNSLILYDGKEFEYHGGSIELWLKKEEGNNKNKTKQILKILERSRVVKENIQEIIIEFNKQKNTSILAIEQFMRKAKKRELKVAGYAAPQKAVTILNSIASSENMIKWIGDISEEKQGTILAGTNIKIISPEELIKKNQDIIIIFAWNLYDEIKEDLTNKGIDPKKLISVKEIESGSHDKFCDEDMRFRE